MQRLSLTILAAGVSAAVMATSLPACAQQPPTIFQNWIANLQSQGYTVTQGSAVEFTSQYCLSVTFPAFGNCFSSDPSDPYLSLLVPVGAGYIDPYFGGVSAVTLPTGIVASQAYRLATNEAVVTVVNLPPQASYLSLQSYLFSRPTADYPGFNGHVSPDPSRAEIFATFNNSINNIAIQKQSGLSFGQGTVGFISTPNGAIATALQNSFASVGGTTNDLFVEQWGNNLNFGLDQAADDFTTVIRYQFPADLAAGNAWRQSPGNNIFVYRIDAPSSVQTKLYGTQTLDRKYANTNESTDHAQTLKELTTILKQWLSGQEKKSVSIYPTMTSEHVSAQGVLMGGNVGPICIQNGTDCNSDQQDTDAYKDGSAGEVTINNLVVITGVNHSLPATDNSNSTSIAISDGTDAIGVADYSTVNSSLLGYTYGALNGSAAAALQTLGLMSRASPLLVRDLPNLYVAIVARSCATQVYCNQSFTTVVTPSEIPLNHLIHVTERAYVSPGYQNGANPNDLLNPNLIY